MGPALLRAWRQQWNRCLPTIQAWLCGIRCLTVLVPQEPEPEQHPAADTDGWDDDFNATEVAEDTEWAGEEAQQAERMKEKMAAQRKKQQQQRRADAERRRREREQAQQPAPTEAWSAPAPYRQRRHPPACGPPVCPQPCRRPAPPSSRSPRSGEHPRGAPHRSGTRAPKSAKKVTVPRNMC